MTDYVNFPIHSLSLDKYKQMLDRLRKGRLRDVHPPHKVIVSRDTYDEVVEEWLTRRARTRVSRDVEKEVELRVTAEVLYHTDIDRNGFAFSEHALRSMAKTSSFLHPHLVVPMNVDCTKKYLYVRDEGGKWVEIDEVARVEHTPPVTLGPPSIAEPIANIPITDAFEAPRKPNRRERRGQVSETSQGWPVKGRRG